MPGSSAGADGANAGRAGPATLEQPALVGRKFPPFQVQRPLGEEHFLPRPNLQSSVFVIRPAHEAHKNSRRETTLPLDRRSVRTPDLADAEDGSGKEFHR